MQRHPHRGRYNTAIIVLLMELMVTSCYNEPLRLDEDGSFSIVQIADVHMGEGESSWGPAVDRRTLAAVDRMLMQEAPNLAILSGDMLTGLNIDTNATAYLDDLTAVFNKHGVPHTMVLGNHDAEPFSGTGQNQSSPGAKPVDCSLCNMMQRRI